jgi:hypothetical protein
VTGSARAWLGLVIALANGGCMIEMAAQLKGPRAPPLRATPEVRVALSVFDPDVESIIGARLAQKPHVTLDPVEAKVRQRYRGSCGVLGCDDAVLLDWARARGDDVIVLGRMVVQRRGIAVCDRYQFGAGPGDIGHCAEEHVENEEADARLEVATWLTARDVRYRRLPAGGLTLRASAQGPGAQARARSDAAAQLSPDVIADALPPQTVVDAAAHLDRDNAPDGSVFAVMRDGKRQGLVRVTSAGSPGQHLDSLYCCLSMRPSDALVLRPPQLLWELLPDAGAMRVSVGGDARLAASLGLALRVRTLDRGWRTGATVERVFAGDARLWLGTFELGYGFRPSPAWALAPVVGIGGGQAERDDATSGSITAAGAHASVFLRATFEPTRFVYLTLDFGVMGSLGYRSWGHAGAPVVGAEPLGLNGPVIRFAASVR